MIYHLWCFSFNVCCVQYVLTLCLSWDKPHYANRTQNLLTNRVILDQIVYKWNSAVCVMLALPSVRMCFMYYWLETIQMCFSISDLSGKYQLYTHSDPTPKSTGYGTDVKKIHMMFTACLPQHSLNPTRSNRSSGLIRNSYFLNKQMIIDNSWLGLANAQDERFTPFWLSRSKGMTVDIWIRDYNPPRCFQ
jgi:hypothetical protein